jgi:hypothetical protein
MVQISADYSRWMAETDIPKLFVNADPGAILTGAARFLPELEKPDRGHGRRLALHPGGFRTGHRPGSG